METRSIRQSVVIDASAREVYEALMDAEKHTAFTGERARIDAIVGGTFTCYGGYISGVNVELEPGKRIVQAWRSKDWPDGHYSIVTFAFAGAGKGRTRLSFTQIGVPASDLKDKTQGWNDHYWRPLKAKLEG